MLELKWISGRCFSNRDAAGGEKHLRKAVQLAPIFAEAHYRLGFELAKSGRMEEAVDELRQARHPAA